MHLASSTKSLIITVGNPTSRSEMPVVKLVRLQVTAFHHGFGLLQSRRVGNEHKQTRSISVILSAEPVC